MYTVDFETEAIVFGSGRAPKPVGVSIKKLGEPGHYYSWGHPTGNNCTEPEAKKALESIWNEHLLFHNAKFDIAVAHEHWSLPWPNKFDDTMFLIYLFNPLADTVSLKPSAERILGLPPEEQEAVRDWLMASGVVPSNSKSWGAYICKAPGDLVGKYADGDTLRTELLYCRLYDEIVRMNMLEAYERELALVQILYQAEYKGVRIDRERLADDIPVYQHMLVQCEDAIRGILGDYPIDTPAQVAKALTANGYVLRKTATGRISTAQDALQEAISDNSDLLSLLKYRGACKTLLGTFMQPWLELSAGDGHLHPSWNSVRGDDYGTRTGRLSCSNPNLQNVPTEFEFNYGGILSGFLPLPYMRIYILPDPGEIIVAADYNGQEMRLLAHFAEGAAAAVYRDDPRADFHEVATRLILEKTGLVVKRKAAKITGFSLIYGAGVGKLSESLKIPVSEGRVLKAAYLKAMVGLEDFQYSVQQRSQVRTWGGRIIPVQPAKHNADGSVWTFNYKLVNHLIQGSAADQTKESIIQYHRSGAKGRFLMTVHDENVISVSAEELNHSVFLLCEAMEGLPNFDVPFIAEVEGGQNWHELETLEK